MTETIVIPFPYRDTEAHWLAKAAGIQEGLRYAFQWMNIPAKISSTITRDESGMELIEITVTTDEKTEK